MQGNMHPGSSERDLENVPYRGQQWDMTPLRTAPLSGSFGVHTLGVPDERPSRKKRLLCFSLLAAAVVAVVVGAVIAGSQYTSSSSTVEAAGGSSQSTKVSSSGAPAPAGQIDSSSSGAGSSSASQYAAGSKGNSSSDSQHAMHDAGSAPAQAPAAESANQSSSGSSTSRDGYTVRFLAVGDWGRQGKSNQSEVAKLMGQVAAADPPAQFVVSTGDNFYDHGLQSAGDPLFSQSFSKVYTAQSLQVPWYAVLGNHDYCDSAPNCAHGGAACKYSPLHQMNIALSNREKSKRWHLQRYYTQAFAGGKVQLFFVDTSPFIKRYYDKSVTWSHCPGGLSTQNWQEQLLVLEQQLAASTADWKIAVGHHPTYSNGHHGNNTDLIQHLEPLLKKYGVQALFTGHDHNLEHLTPGGYNVVVTGAGSATDREQLGDAYSQYYHPYSGFVSVSVQPEALTVDFFTLEGEESPAYTARISLSGESE